MVVGEPSLMGGELGDVDERLITRLENEQYDPANGLHDDGLHDYANSQALSNSSPWNGQPPGNQDSKPDAMATQQLE